MFRSPSTSSRGPLALAILAATLCLLPSLGYPGLSMVQDTLKSALLAIGVLLAALALVGAGSRTQQPVRWHVMLCLPLALALYALSCTAWSHPYLGAGEAARWLVLGLLMWLVLNTRTVRSTMHLARAIHAGTCIASVWACAQFWFDLQWFPQGPSPASTFFNRNFFAEYAVGALPFSVWVCWQLRTTRQVMFTGVLLALNLSAICMTGTRSALLALVIVAPLLIVLVVRQRQLLPWYSPARLRQFGLVTLLGLLVFLNIPARSPTVLAETPDATAWRRSTQRVASVSTPAAAALQASAVPATSPSAAANMSIVLRSAMWRATVRMMAANPWRGVGAGAWEVAAPLYQDSNTTLEIDYYPHNEYLQLLAEYGMPVGGLVLAVLLAYLIKALSWSRLLPAALAHEIPARNCALLALLGLGIVSALGFPWHQAASAALFAVALGMLFASDARLAHDWPAGVEQPAQLAALTSLSRQCAIRVATRRIMLAVILSGLALASYLTVRAMRAEHLLLHALQCAHTLPATPAALSAEQQARKQAMLDELRAGVALNPHYRKFIPLAAEVLIAQEDWVNATWVLHSSVASRPNVYAFWQGLTLAALRLHHLDEAADALHHLELLRPQASTTHAFAIILSGLRGDYDTARALLAQQFAHPDQPLDYEIPQTGYLLGLQLHDQSLAAQSLMLRQRYWPQQAADTFMRLGRVYADMAPVNAPYALQAFADGLNSVPPAQRPGYLAQVPQPYSKQLAGLAH